MLDTYKEFSGLRFENHAPGVLELVFDGPHLNAVDARAHADLPRVWPVVDQDPEVRTVLVRGSGRAFSAGGSFELIEEQIADYDVRMRVMREARDLYYGLVNCSKPVVSALHGPAVGAGLVVAMLSGLGSIGGIDIPPEEVEREIKLFRWLSDRPLCVDLGFPANAPGGLDDVEIPELPGPLQQLKKELDEHGVEVVPTTDQAISLEDNRKKLEISLDLGVEVIACALGTPKWVVEACHARGAKVMSIVGRPRHARSAIRNGADVVIVQGTEGGGHTGDVGLITLLAEVLEFATVPVVAAGGLVKGSQIAACLTMGAQGVWVGTRFLATRESGSEDVFKEAVVEAEYDSTLRSLLFDGLHVRMLGG